MCPFSSAFEIYLAHFAKVLFYLFIYLFLLAGTKIQYICLAKTWSELSCF